MKHNYNHLHWTIGIIITFLLTVFFFQPIREHVFIGTIILFLLLLWLFKKSRNAEKNDLYLITGSLLFFMLAKILFPILDQKTLTLRAAGIVSFILLNLVLLIGPWSRFSTKVMKYYQYRRHLGVAVFFFACLHVAIILPFYFNNSSELAFTTMFTFYGTTAFFLLFWLAITSQDTLQKIISERMWKLIHGLLLIMYLLLAYQVYNINQFEQSTFHMMTITLFIIFWLVVAPYSIIQQMMKTWVFGWKQLHVLIYVLYISTILHVAFGSLLTTPLWVKILFWSLIIFVFGSHLYGLIQLPLEKKLVKDRIEKIGKKIRENGKTYIGIAKTANFIEGKGQKFYVNNKPIAIFKTKDGFVAMSDLCKHQKGPLHKGILQHGTVQCPWHYWVYDVKNGNYLGKEPICLETYELIIKEGVVYIDVDT